MNSPSTHAVKTGSPSGEGSSSVSSRVDQRVAQCAVESTNQAEFLKRLAAEIAKDFPIAIVAVESAQWAAPMMLVTSDDLAQKIDRESIRQLLSNAAVVPIACDISLEIPTDDGVDRTRALRVELSQAPRRSAILLVYPAETTLTPTEQLQALKLLNQYTVSARREFHQVTPSTRALATDDENVASALRARHALLQFHADLDLEATAYRIANETRRLLHCDRTTVLVKRGNRFRVSAISGIAVVDGRSNSVRAAEELALSASVLSRPMQLPSDEPLPPQIQEPLDDYLDQTSVGTTILLPLHEPDESDHTEGVDGVLTNTLEGNGEIIAMMMLEYFSGQPSHGINQATALVASEAMYSLRNSISHRNVFGLSLWRSIGNVVHSGKMPLISFGVFAAVGLLLMSIFIQTEHHVIATGSAEPTIQRQVFASIDGVVKEINVTDGQVVAADQPLLRLENADLESRAESLAGELQTATRRLASISAMRLSAETDPAQAGRLALEERQLRSEIKNLQSQQQLVHQQQDDLIVRSPIAGTVVGWQLDQRLSDRPITRGNLLMRIVDHNGDWSLKLNLPDDEAGPVLQAMEEADKLPVQFAIATDPDGSFSAYLTSVATAARLDETGQHVVDAVADVGNVPKASTHESPSQKPSVQQPESGSDRQFNSDPRSSSALADSSTISFTHEVDDQREAFDPAAVRVGADVTARISCGKRSVIRSWFSDVFDFVDRNVLFYFR